MPAYPRQRIKLIFNPAAGRSDATRSFLLDVITALQSQNFIPEVYIIEPDVDIFPVLEDALKRKIRLFVICGEMEPSKISQAGQKINELCWESSRQELKITWL